ncbi:helix-turn-helix domain-containing protein [Planctomicrobium sp. SH661]|uniref:DnaA/Hda family protein n=1 Tax=Planctomicrobium sp. SH661 TaxID=3448124 RepID=UPI003F5B5494
MSQLIRQSDQRAFLVLPENELAVAAVKKLAPGIKRRRVWMVTLVGPSGTGKSHLARELVRSWESERPDGKLLLFTASQFAAQLADASAAGTLQQFQAKHRNDVHLLICEDVHVLGPRKESQLQLLAAIDDVIASGGVVLLTSTKMPGAIKDLSRRLVNRMHGGLCVEIGLPGPASRRELVDQYLSVESLPLSEQEIAAIVAQPETSPRELIGLLSQLQSESKLRVGKQRATRLNVKAAIAERQRQLDLSLPEITRATAEKFGVKVSELKGASRVQSLSLARQTAMYLARDLAQLHYVQIGEFFQRGNHSTVIHACQKIAKQLTADPILVQKVQSIREQLLGRG